MVIDSRAGVSSRRRPLSQRRLAASAAHWRLCWRSCFTAAKPTLTSRARSTSWSSTTYSLDASTPPHHRHAVSHSAAQINTVLQDGVVWAVAALRTAKHPRHPVWRPPSVSSSLTHPAFLVHLHPPLLFLCCTSPFVQGQSRQPRGGWGVLVHTTAFPSHLPFFEMRHWPRQTFHKHSLFWFAELFDAWVTSRLTSFFCTPHSTTTLTAQQGGVCRGCDRANTMAGLRRRAGASTPEVTHRRGRRTAVTGALSTSSLTTVRGLASTGSE
jgi:hypothetical protein